MTIKKAVTFVCASVGALMLSCVTQATDDEINEMCDNLVELRGEIPNPSAETITSDISLKFDEEAQQIESSKAAELESLKNEMDQRLEAANLETEKVDIRNEYKQKLEAAAEAHSPKLAAINAEKSKAVARAKKEAQENTSLWTEAVNQCIEDAKNEGVSQQLARCRIQAKSTDKYWNGCR